LALLSFFPAMAEAAAPVAWWKLDDNAASASVVRSAGSYNGANNSGFNSPQNTTLSHSADRPEGTGSFYLDGVNDYIQVTGYKGISGGASRTCAAWVKTTASQQCAIVAWGSISPNGSSWVFRVEQGGQLGVGVFGGTIKTTTTTLNDNTWHHVAAVLNNDGTPNVNEVRLYIDGVQQSTTSAALAIDTASLADVRIGAFTADVNEQPNMYFKGLLDDVRIYDYALSTAEILALNTWRPSPRDGAVNAATNSLLSWAAQAGALSYNVYLGTDPAAVANANTDPLAGDITGDHSVDSHDLSLLGGQWMTNPGATNQSADIKYDGIVNFGDFALLATTWGQTAEFKGNQTGTNYNPGLLDCNRNYYWRVDVVTASGTTAGPVRGFTTIGDGALPAIATNPTPADGATNVSIGVSYSWSATKGATSYKVYRGTSLPLSGSPTTVAIPSLTGATLANNTTCYWRVDAANVSGTTTGTVWSFTTELLTTPPGLASNPSPANGENFVSPYTELRWTAGTNTVTHDVYFGTANPPPYIGQTTTPNFAPGLLTTNATYYWRVNENNSVGTTTGVVWSITTEARLTPEQFVILPWDGPGRNYSKTYSVDVCSTIRDCGFNLAGFVEPGYLDDVAASGIKALAFTWNTAPLSDTMANWPKAAIDYQVTNLVNQVSNKPALFGYFLADEPPPSRFAGLANWRASFQAADPSKKTYINLGWDYDYADFIPTVQNDFLSYDWYGLRDNDVVDVHYFPCLEKVRSFATSSGQPFWNTVSSMRLLGVDSDGNPYPPWNVPAPTPANLRFQLYTSLAYGAAGIAWFTYFSRDAAAPIQYGQKTIYWDYLRDVNLQMHRIGQTYITLAYQNVFHYPNVPAGQPYMNYPGRGIATSQHVQSLSGGDYVVGEFTGPSSKKWIMVVNKSLTTNATLNVTFKSAGTIYRLNSATGQLQLFSQGQTLLPGEGMLLKLN